MASSQPPGKGALEEGGRAPVEAFGGLEALRREAASDGVWSMVLERAPFGFAVLDSRLRYVHVNRYLAALNGVPADEHIGRTPRQVVPATVAELAMDALQRVLVSGETVDDLELTRSAPNAPDDTRHFHATYHPVLDGRGAVAGVCAVVVDVTERQFAEEALAAQARRQMAVADLGQRALVHADVDALLADVVSTLARVLEAPHVAVFEAADDGSLRVRARSDRDRDARAAGRDEAVDPLAVAVDAVVPGGLDSAALGPFRSDCDLGSAALVVIRGERAPYGLLGALTPSRPGFSDAEVTFLQSVANTVGAVVEQRRAAEDLRATAEQLQLALSAGELGYWEWDVVADRISWSQTLEAMVGVSDPEGSRSFADYLAIVHPDDRLDVAAEIRAAVEGGGGGVCEYEHRIVHTDGAVRWLHGRFHVQRDQAGRALRLVGLSGDVTERKEAERARDRALDAERTARAAAEEAGRRLAFLAEATARMTASLDVPSTLTAVARLAVPVLADVCAVLLGEGVGSPEVVVAARDEETEALARDVVRRCADDPRTVSPLHTVQHTGRSEYHPAVPDDLWPRCAVDGTHLGQLRQLGVRSAVCVPLSVRGLTIGVAAFGRLGAGHPYDQSDLVLAEELGRRAALAIDNARLFQQVQRTGERSRRLAETLRRSLLPPRLPRIPGFQLAAAYHPAARDAAVGGDFYDVFPLGGGRWAMVMGDVCGKGPDAAALTALARYTVRTLALTEDSPAAVLTALNDAVLRECGGSQYCTVAYAVLCPRTGDLTTVCGGHPLPLLRRGAGGIRAAATPGTLIGLLETLDITERRITIAPGDTLLLYTDGVVDAGIGGDVFGEERLAERFAALGGHEPQEVVRRLEAEVLEFCDDRPRDDLAMLVVRMEDGSPTTEPGTHG